MLGLVSYDEVNNAYSITKSGYIAIALFMMAVLIGVVLLSDRKNIKLGVREMTVTAVLVALGYALSFIRVVPMPWGGSVTLCSMLFVCLTGYIYGARTGLIGGLLYGVLQLLADGGGYMLSPFQVACDYIFSFMGLGISGLLNKKKNGLVTGYILAITVRGVFNTLGGYIYWMDYIPSGFPVSIRYLYPLVYNYSYILAEGVVTVVVISVPAVRKTIDKVKRIALGC